MSMKTLKAGSVALALAVTVLTFGLANPGSAGAWLHGGTTYQYPAEGGEWQYGAWTPTSARTTL